MEFYIIKHNIWFYDKTYQEGDCAKFDPADPEVQKLVAKGFIESTGTLVDASEPEPTMEEEPVKEEVEVEPEPVVEPESEPEQDVEPEPEPEEVKEDLKLNKKGRRK